MSYRILGKANLKRMGDFGKEGFMVGGEYIPLSAIERTDFTKDGAVIVLKKNWRNNDTDKRNDGTTSETIPG